RRREIAIRGAFGAGRGRLVTQFLIESVVLAGAGGLAGAVLGYAGARTLVRFAPVNIPRLDTVSIDVTVLGFMAGLCLLTAVLFGLAPVLGATRSAPADTIRDGGRGASQGVAAKGFRSALVVCE